MLTSRIRAEQGNTLVLFPAAVVVMFLLASIAIDAAVSFNANRQLHDIAGAVANDAASAVATAGLYESGELTLDPAIASQRRDSVLARRTDAARISASCATPSISDRSVQVTCTGEVPQLISPMRLLGISTRELAATAAAELRTN